MKAVKLAILLSAIFVSSVCLQASDKPKEKSNSKVADSGSFGIFLNGKRVGTETFNITETLTGDQRSGYSTTTSEIKFDDGKFKADQTAEMQVSAKGELRSYVWHATVPQKEESSVELKDQLLVEHVMPADQKKVDVPHMLPVSTVILDDNFFLPARGSSVVVPGHRLPPPEQRPDVRHRQICDPGSPPACLRQCDARIDGTR